jgi:hypothetical protein
VQFLDQPLKLRNPVLSIACPSESSAGQLGVSVVKVFEVVCVKFSNLAGIGDVGRGRRGAPV